MTFRLPSFESDFCASSQAIETKLSNDMDQPGRPCRVDSHISELQTVSEDVYLSKPCCQQSSMFVSCDFAHLQSSTI